MKRITFLKSLLLAAGLSVGASAWAYEVPDGYEIKEVILGIDNGNGTVTAENFETTSSLSSSWGSGTLWNTNNTGMVNLTTITEVVKPAVGEIVNSTTTDGVTTFDKPTYVSEKAVMFRNRTNKVGSAYGTYSFDAVSSGKIIFSGDLYTNTTAQPLELTFVDNEGNTVIKFHWNNGQGTRPFNFEYTNTEGTSTTGGGSIGYCDYRNYKGYGIRDFVLDFATGEFEFTIDFINTRDANAPKRDQVRFTGVIQTNRNIAQLRLGTPSTGGNTTNYDTYIDNVSLYTIGAAAGSYNYTVKAQSGEMELATLDAGTCKGGMNYSVAGLPLVIKGSDGKFYVLDDEDVANYKKTFLMGNTDQESVVNYSLDASIVAFTESGTETKGEGNYSNGAVGSVNTGGYNHLTSGLNLGSVDAGVYKFVAYVTGNQTRGLAVRNNAVDNSSNNYAQINETGVKEVEFVLPETRTLILTGRYTNGTKTNQSSDFDYVIIRKISNLPTTEDVVVSSAGYATYVSDYNLDFSQATTKAYKVYVENKGVAKLTEVAKVPAKTPVLLYREGGNGEGEAIAITTDAVEAVTGNNLVAGTGAALATIDGDYTNMILNNVGGKIGFYFAANQTVAKNRAYLRIASNLAPDATNGSRMVMTFDDDQTTGISSIENGQLTMDKVYNLKGQRVANPAKGLYIVNGKKVVIK